MLHCYSSSTQKPGIKVSLVGNEAHFMSQIWKCFPSKHHYHPEKFERNIYLLERRNTLEEKVFSFITYLLWQAFCVCGVGSHPVCRHSWWTDCYNKGSPLPPVLQICVAAYLWMRHTEQHNQPQDANKYNMWWGLRLCHIFEVSLTALGESGKASWRKGHLSWGMKKVVGRPGKRSREDLPSIHSTTLFALLRPSTVPIGSKGSDETRVYLFLTFSCKVSLG